MLQKNPLQPPRPSPVPPGPALRRRPLDGASRGFTSAEDFDATGILAGVDPCESRYWWLPELATGEGAPARPAQAARRSPPAADA